MRGIDLFSPWREGPSALAARNVGREAELDAIRSAARAFGNGASPLPLYLFGAHGMGKSHLLTLAIAAVQQVTPASEVAITIVPDDAIAMRSAAMLFNVMMDGSDRQPWLTWPERDARSRDERHRVVLFEGLDRQLRALGTQGRRELRQLLGDAPRTWIVGAGMTLPDELTAADEAFFAAFDPWPLDALSDDDGGELLDRISGESPHDPAWRGPRRTLLTVAGGNPRTLVALGRARVDDPALSASELLRRVVYAFTPQHRIKLRALSPQAQRIVSHLAAAPRELGPSDLAATLQSSTTQMSVQARRLVDDGVLRHRSDGRQTWYRIADPLFRYWLEYRNARWAETRAGWVADRLDAWHHEESETMSDVADLRVASKAWRDLWDELLTSVRPFRDGQVGAALERAQELRGTKAMLRSVLGFSLIHDLGAVVDETLQGELDAFSDLESLAILDRALRDQTAPPRDAFLDFVARPIVARRDTANILSAILARSAYGPPWSFRRGERSAVAKLPFVRALFLRQGRWWSHTPLLAPADVVASLEAEPEDAASLLVEGIRLDHPELARGAARAMLNRGYPLPRCPRLTAVDEETATLLARLFVESLSDPEAVGIALGWVAALAGATDAAFATVVSAAARASQGPEPPGKRGRSSDGRPAVMAPEIHGLVELALAYLAAAHAARFAELVAALPQTYEATVGRAQELAREIEEAPRGQLQTELAVLHRAIDRHSEEAR